MEELTLEEIELIKQTQQKMSSKTHTQLMCCDHPNTSVLNAFSSMAYVTSDIQILSYFKGHTRDYAHIPAF